MTAPPTWEGAPLAERRWAFAILAVALLLDEVEKNDQLARDGLTRFESPLELELVALARRLGLWPKGST